MDSARSTTLRGILCKKTAVIAVCISASLFLAQEYASTQAIAMCEFHHNSEEYEQVLPAGHLVTQCGATMVSEVSWLEWFSGKSSSYQFHFFDLLELLYGKSESVSSALTDH